MRHTEDFSISIETRNNIIFIQVIKYDENDICDLMFEKQLDKLVEDISAEYSQALHIIKVNKFTVPQRFALFTQASALYYLQIREGNCMVILLIYLVC